MQIKLIKVGKTPLDFDIKSGKITFKGFLQYHTGKLILLKAKLYGLVDIECSHCAEDFELEVDEDIEFFISDGLYEDTDNIELDVIESFNSLADLDELLNSEIELIKSDYHTCKNCASL
ncbi:MAG: hypothetical protein ABGW74_00380 [Campylobacterales bacterium]|jgi:uncharacterized metal-binding protein YceD (DUF177 family)